MLLIQLLHDCCRGFQPLTSTNQRSPELLLLFQHMLKAWPDSTCCTPLRRPLMNIWTEVCLLHMKCVSPSLWDAHTCRRSSMKQSELCTHVENLFTSCIAPHCMYRCTHTHYNLMTVDTNELLWCLPDTHGGCRTGASPPAFNNVYLAHVWGVNGGMRSVCVCVCDWQMFKIRKGRVHRASIPETTESVTTQHYHFVLISNGMY